MIYQFWVVFLALLVIFIYSDLKFGLLRDTSQANPQPYSWGRVQLAWWTLIIISSFIAIFWKTGDLPDLPQSTIILLGISAVTTTTARMIDVSDMSKGYVRHQNESNENLVLDILSDQKGVSIHRFQTILFNAVFGVWFIKQVLDELSICASSTCVNSIIPDIDTNNLILLGVSGATYAAMKMTENNSGAAGSQKLTGSTTTTITTPAPSNTTVIVPPPASQ